MTKPVALDAITGYTVSMYWFNQKEARLFVDRDEAFAFARDNSFDWAAEIIPEDGGTRHQVHHKRVSIFALRRYGLPELVGQYRNGNIVPKAEWR